MPQLHNLDIKNETGDSIKNRSTAGEKKKKKVMPAYVLAIFLSNPGHFSACFIATVVV